MDAFLSMSARMTPNVPSTKDFMPRLRVEASGSLGDVLMIHDSEKGMS
jgi:hypothetical protein